jgi:hypothetical protein
MARPTKLTPELAEKVITAIRAGNYASVSCQRVGISESTYYRWLERGESETSGIYREFLDQIRSAEAEAETHAVAIVRRAMGHEWRAAIAYLERRHPARWRRQTSTELTGPDGGPLQSQQTSSIDLSTLTEKELDQLEAINARAAKRR